VLLGKALGRWGVVVAALSHCSLPVLPGRGRGVRSALAPLRDRTALALRGLVALGRTRAVQRLLRRERAGRDRADRRQRARGHGTEGEPLPPAAALQQP